ncbi:MAG TPA: family 43 glycosylhydrolase [Phycisphaerae bacterium]|nr:family 43 glycosylhydrolase [Phycisphaerae bacterium]HPP25612.1 family 43 glycosylhydrolase [Phycisphaerae bacterium]
MRRAFAGVLVVIGLLASALAEPATPKQPAGPGAGSNIAARAKVYATSSLPGHPAEHAIDDSAETAWRAANADAVLWLDFGARMRLAGLSHVIRAGDSEPAATEIVTWQNGWTPIGQTAGRGEPVVAKVQANTQYIGIRSSAGSAGRPLTIETLRAFQAGWRPQRDGKDLRLQDFCFFRHDGYTYIGSMMKDFGHEGITIARSRDLIDWEPLGIAVSRRTPEDKAMLWAPHVVEHAGEFHMFYTGVTQPKPNHWNQKILVATTKDPANPKEWQRNHAVKFIVDGRTESWFRPSHPGHVWPADGWADCRDPMVYYNPPDRTWYLFYSGSDTTGGIVGVATAPDILGPWEDRGPVLCVDRGVPESAFVLPDPAGGYVMVINHSTPDRIDGGIKIARARSLLPENGKPSFTGLELLEPSAEPGLVGWAHEFAMNPDGTVLAAYLTGYFINFQDARFVKGKGGWTVSGIPETTGPK